MKKLKLIVLWSALISLIACKPNENQPTTNCLTDKATGKLLIGNEGNFNWGVGTLSLYDTVSEVVIDNLYQCQNVEPAGNVLHSLYQQNNEVFVVVNNTRKVEVLNSETLKRKRTISNLNSPRYIIGSLNKLFISDLYNNKISILGSNATQTERYIPVFGWVEKLFTVTQTKIIGVRTYRMGVTAFAASALLFIDSETEQITDSIRVNNAITDAHLEGNFMLLSTTDYNSTTNDSLLVIDVNAKKIITRASLSGTKGRVSRISYSAKYKALYYVKYDVNKIAWDAENPLVIGQPQIALPKTQGQEFYALGLPIGSSNQLFISDANNYTANGEVLIFDLDQQKVIKKISAGIIPSSLLWIQ